MSRARNAYAPPNHEHGGPWCRIVKNWNPPQPYDAITSPASPLLCVDVSLRWHPNRLAFVPIGDGAKNGRCVVTQKDISVLMGLDYAHPRATPVSYSSRFGTIAKADKSNSLSCAMRRIIQYRCRDDGRTYVEPVFAERSLNFLYGNWLGRLLASAIMKRHVVSHMYGWFQNRPASRKKIRGFVFRLGIDPSEAQRPLDDFVSLNDFFTRRLKPECRPINQNPNVLVSPADGRVLAFPALANNAVLTVKNCRVTVGELLADFTEARRFERGPAVVVRLAPADYHRFHFPDSGTAPACFEAGRGLHSVHTIALSGGASSFLNHRMICLFDSCHFGKIALIEVGAMLVGRITQTFTPGPVSRGQEKGFFSFGGSTIIMLFEPGHVVLDNDLVGASATGLETLVKFGSGIGKKS